MRLRNLILPVAVVLAAPVSSALAAPAPIMPLSEVQPGMSCTGETVISGTTISSFTVDVINVVDDEGEGARILVRVSGPAVDSTGVAEGFSGSPVYCPTPAGTLANAGAISEGVGDYGNFLALVTPIQQMLGEPVRPPSGAPRMSLRARPLAGPLTVSGLSPALFNIFQRAESRTGRTVLAAPASGGAVFPVQPLVPGASVAASYSTGTVAMGAIGTVTYRDGNVVYAFGHPLDDAGRRALMLQDAYVYGVVSDPEPLFGSFKLAVPGHTEGTLTSDTPNAVVGEVGPSPSLIPIDITAHDLDTGNVIEEDSQVADESGVGYPLGTSLLDMVAPLAIPQAATDVYDGAPANESGTMCLRVQLRESRQPLKFCDRYVGTGGTASSEAEPTELASATMTDVTNALSLLDEVDFAQLHVVKVSAVIDARRGLSEAQILSASARHRVHPGQLVTVRLRVRRYRSSRQTITLKLRIPRGIRGAVKVTIHGPVPPAPPSSSGEGPTSELITVLFGGGQSSSTGPNSLVQLRKAFAGLATYDGLTAHFRGHGSVRPYRDAALLITGSARLSFRVGR